jgi:hypothetical protein
LRRRGAGCCRPKAAQVSAISASSLPSSDGRVNIGQWPVSMST